MFNISINEYTHPNLWLCSTTASTHRFPKNREFCHRKDSVLIKTFTAEPVYKITSSLKTHLLRFHWVSLRWIGYHFHRLDLHCTLLLYTVTQYLHLYAEVLTEPWRLDCTFLFLMLFFLGLTTLTVSVVAGFRSCSSTASSIRGIFSEICGGKNTKEKWSSPKMWVVQRVKGPGIRFTLGWFNEMTNIQDDVT